VRAELAAAVDAAQADKERAVASAVAAATAAAVDMAEAEKEEALRIEAASARTQIAAAVAAARAEAEAALAAATVSAAVAGGKQEVRAHEEASPSQAALALQPKLDALSRMVREQQAELMDGYRFAAAVKVGAALDRRVAMALSASLGAWRVATMALAVAASVRAAPATAGVQPAHAEQRRLASPRPPLPTSSSSSGLKATAPTPAAATPAGSTTVLASASPRASSPTLQAQLDEARMQTTRSSSPTPGLHGQLQQALQKRSSRLTGVGDDGYSRSGSNPGQAERDLVP
jgi:SWI/SNF-related matrix-associated actin-dependent regulator 1 of chromatin subfamily A